MVSDISFLTLYYMNLLYKVFPNLTYGMQYESDNDRQLNWPVAFDDQHKSPHFT